MNANSLLEKAFTHKVVGFQDTVTWRPTADLNDYGEPIPANDEVISCRIDRGQTRLVTSISGKEIVSDTQIITKAAIKPNDQIVFASGEVYRVVFSNPMHLSGVEVYREVSLSPSRSV